MPSHKRNRFYKPILQAEFSRTCVYCRKSDCLDSYGFGVDHYKPVSKFGQSAYVYNNLYYSCNSCNLKKSNYWPTKEDRNLDCFIPNPSDHIMLVHLRMVNNIVESNTTAGKFTIDLLRLNSDQAVTYRRSISKAILALKVELTNKYELIGDLQHILEQEPDHSKIVEVTHDIEALNSEIEEIQQVLSTFQCDGDGVIPQNLQQYL